MWMTANRLPIYKDEHRGKLLTNKIFVRHDTFSGWKQFGKKSTHFEEGATVLCERDWQN